MFDFCDYFFNLLSQNNQHFQGVINGLFSACSMKIMAVQSTVMLSILQLKQQLKVKCFYPTPFISAFLGFFILKFELANLSIFEINSLNLTNLKKVKIQCF